MTTHKTTPSAFDLLLNSFESINTTDHPDCGQFGVEQFGWRELSDGRVIAMIPTLSGNWRIVIGKGQFLDNGWCYDRRTKSLQAITALAYWDGAGDPIDGWHRNPFDGRRRTDGDPAREHHAP